MTRWGDAVKECAVRGGGVDDPVLRHEDIGVAEFGNRAEHVAHEAIVEAATIGFDQRAGVVGIVAACLGVTGAHSRVGRRNGDSVTESPFGAGMGAS